MNNKEILKLDNGIEYLVLDEATLDDLEFVYALLLVDGRPTQEYKIFEKQIIDDKIWTLEVENAELFKKLMAIFTKSYYDYVSLKQEEN